MLILGPLLTALWVGGCTHQRSDPLAEAAAGSPPVVVAVAPVLNLSNSSDWDPLRLTDIVASELQSFPGLAVIPVNRSLAGLALTGKDSVATAADALELARQLDADAVVVTAITEYDPYDPPVVGVLMQWYAVRDADPVSDLDPVSASRQAAAVEPGAAVADQQAPLVQVQRVYDAAHQAVQKDLRDFAARRRGRRSPYGWRVYLKSQELFLRYCCWATIRPMLLARSRRPVATTTTEVNR